MGISRLVKLFPISFLLVPCVISAAAEVVTEGLVLNYDFTAGSMPGADSTVKDLSGNGIDGVMRPIGPFTPRIPRTGSGFFNNKLEIGYCEIQSIGIRLHHIHSRQIRMVAL